MTKEEKEEMEGRERRRKRSRGWREDRSMRGGGRDGLATFQEGEI